VRIFVAGAGGYIGLPLCEELVRRGHVVTAFDTYWFGKEPVGCAVMHGDIRQVGEFGDATDVVIDLAGISNDAACELDPDLTWEINCKGARRLALKAKIGGVKRYIYSSSASVYGNNPKIGLVETDAPKPLTTYAKCKVIVEDFLWNLEGDDFRVSILRNATVFGVSKRMRFDLVLNAMTLSGWRDGVITVDGDGEQWRPLIHIDDLVREFADRVETGESKTENMVAFNWTVAALASRIANTTGSEIRFQPSQVDKRSYNLAPTVFKGKLIQDGIEEVWEALDTGAVDPDDPTCWTVKWYKQLGLKPMAVA
jgi:nucleoside-diphosphate-sugar epimerase